MNGSRPFCFLLVQCSLAWEPKMCEKCYYGKNIDVAYFYHHIFFPLSLQTGCFQCLKYRGMDGLGLLGGAEFYLEMWFNLALVGEIRLVCMIFFAGI